MNNEICVAASALGIGGGAGSPTGETMAEGEPSDMVTPDSGDSVEFTGKGRVTRVEGGNAYIRATEINGQPVMGQNEPDGDEAAMDREMEGMSAAGGGGYSSARGLVILFLTLLLGGSARAEKTLEQATARTCSGTQVSNYVAVATQTQVYSVLVDNYTGSTLYLLVYDSPTNSLAGRVPHITSVPCSTGTATYQDFGAAGLPMDYGVNVCLSTTPYSLTNAASGGTVTVIHSGGRR